MFKFSIRDVLWLTLVVGMAVGWWQSAYERSRANKRASWLLDYSTQMQAVEAKLRRENDKLTADLNQLIRQSEGIRPTVEPN